MLSKVKHSINPNLLLKRGRTDILVDEAQIRRRDALQKFIFPEKVRIINPFKRQNTLFIQESELDKAHTVVMHEPGEESLFGALHPNASLFEQPLSISNAKNEFRMFRDELEKHNINTYTIRDILNKVSHSEIVSIAQECVRYKIISSPDYFDYNEQDITYLNNDYKRKSLEKFNKDELINMILTQPIIKLMKANKNTEWILKSITLNPMMNLLFARDQQIVTKNGLILCSMNSYQRKKEIKLMKNCWKILNIPIIYEINNINNTKFIEGGDFIPFNKEYCFIQCGLRTNMNAIQELLKNDCFGTKYVCIVLDEYDQNQDRMHLDCIWNIISNKYCVLLDTIINFKDNPNMKRVVIKYKRVKNNNSGKFYYKIDDRKEFTDFLKNDMKMKIIPITEEDQLKYMINFVNLGDGNIFSVNIGLNEVLQKYMDKDDYKNINFKYVHYHNVTRMYGAAHCTTQVFRTPSISS